MSRPRIDDELKDLDLDRRTKWMLRNPDKVNAYKAKYKASDKGKEANRRHYEKRKLSTSSND